MADDSKTVKIYRVAATAEDQNGMAWPSGIDL